jgi:hypothetical protein
MKNYFSIVLFLLVNAVLFSEDNYSKIKKIEDASMVNEFPSTQLYPPQNGLIASIFDKVVMEIPISNEDLSIFGDNIIYEVSKEYMLDNIKREVKYYILFYGFNRINYNNNIPQGETIGRANSNTIELLAFSQEIDPYLVISSPAIPVFYKNYYWFNANFLFNTGTTNFLEYEPVENIGEELSNIARESFIDGPGLSWYNGQKIRFQFTLQSYPRLIDRNDREIIKNLEISFYGREDVMKYISEIKIGEFNYNFYWQDNFLKYLIDINAINKNIWIYGSLIEYNSFENRGIIFIRDFQSNSLEDEYKRRIEFFK